MMGHKKCFYGEIWLIIPKLFLLALFILSTVGDVKYLGISNPNCGTRNDAMAHVKVYYVHHHVYL